MTRQHIIGFTLCILLFFTGFLIKGNVGLYFNIAGFMIVIGGSSAATLICFNIERLKIVYKVTRHSFTSTIKSEREIVDILIDLAIKSRIKGILSLQKEEDETTILFLRRALSCLVDRYEPQQIRDILNTEMYFFKLRREDSERIIRTIADFLPVFGIIGSIVGLISMLAGIGDTSVILKTIPVALTSTLYGLIFSNFLFIPFAANLRERTNQELLLQKIIMEGVIAINAEMNTMILKTKLESFLTPSERDGHFVSYQQIRERFKILEEEEANREEKANREEE
jgi:chemotaxis protein MotA